MKLWLPETSKPRIVGDVGNELAPFASGVQNIIRKKRFVADDRVRENATPPGALHTQNLRARAPTKIGDLRE